MTIDVLAHFNNESYLNLETFRKNGSGVQTPVWFARDGERLYARTIVSSWKVKRLRRNLHARIAPCDMRGNVHGPWVEAQVRLVPEDERATIRHANAQLRKKYGLRRLWFDIIGIIQRRQFVILEIQATTAPE